MSVSELDYVRRKWPLWRSVVERPPKQDGIMRAMRTTIDRAGRIVVPKSLRDQLSLMPGLELELTASEGHLEIEPVPTPMRLERRDGRLVAITDKEMPPLSEDVVRAALEQARERR
jgi:AbrB family looped-hinge helix DNA binding protein